MFQRSCILISILLFITGCFGAKTETVSYDVYRLPTNGFDKMNFLGVTKTKGIATNHTDFLVKKISRCGQYAKTTRLNTTFKLPRGDDDVVRKSMRSSTKKFQDTRYVHGVLTVELIKNNVKKRKKPATLIFAKDKLDYKWFDSYGNAAHPNNSVYGGEEIGPKIKYLGKKINRSVTDYNIGVRYALYNKNKDKLILDKTSFIGASLITYSKKPVLKDKSVQGYLFKHLMARIARTVCPKIASVSRTLYGGPTPSKSNTLIDQGIDLATDKKWDEAGDKWKKAVLHEKSNSLAHHNLGVFYERTGNVPASMEEFERAKKGKYASMMKPLQYYDSISLFRPKYDPVELEPHIYGVSGANWVSIYGGKENALKPGRTYSVYRTRRLTAPPSYRVDGMNLSEVGRVKIIKKDPPFMLGRIIEFLEPQRIEMGDVILIR